MQTSVCPYDNESAVTLSAPCPYKASMQRLLQYVGIQHYGTEVASVPERSAAETTRIADNFEAVFQAALVRAGGDEAMVESYRMEAARHTTGDATEEGVPIPTTTIFKSVEECLEWKAYLRGTPVSERHAATARRRLTVHLWRASQRRLCLYCWFPSDMCMCPELELYKLTLPRDTLVKLVQVTMVLHVEEVMRSTNSGHVAAFLLGAPMRVWGVTDDDKLLQEITSVDEGVVPAGSVDGPTTPVQNVVLYPETGAPSLDSFVRKLPLYPIGQNLTGAAVEPRNGDSSTCSMANRALLSAPIGDQTTGRRTFPRVHLLLLDSTWGQALSLNRHISRSVTRVGLHIPADYDSLFVGLRKRTRASGVSTMEATTLAVQQVLCALSEIESATVTQRVLTDAMKEFVDLQCLLKYADTRFATQPEEVAPIVARRDALRREAGRLRLEQLEARVLNDNTARAFLPPPVSNYCYCCDRVIGWHRMPEHALGRGHQQALKGNPSCIPTEFSRSVIVHSFVRPPRRRTSKETLPQRSKDPADH